MVITTYEQIAAGVRAISEHRFSLACDLGQSSDPTAVAVIEHVRTRRVHQKGHEMPMGEEFRVRHLQRLPLGLSYVEQASRIGFMLARPPLHLGCEFLIDESSIGRPVGDIFNANGLTPTRITITAGDGQSQRSATRWHVSKSVLISALDARLHTGELRIAEDLPEAAVLKEELVDFRRHSNAGHVSFSARIGRHDDCLLAVAIALWAHVGRKKTPPAQVGHARFVPTRQRQTWRSL